MRKTFQFVVVLFVHFVGITVTAAMLFLYKQISNVIKFIIDKRGSSNIFVYILGDDESVD